MAYAEPTEAGKTGVRVYLKAHAPAQPSRRSPTEIVARPDTGTYDPQRGTGPQVLRNAGGSHPALPEPIYLSGPGYPGTHRSGPRNA